EIFEEMVAAFEQSGQGLKKRPVGDFLEFWQEKAQEKIISLAPGNQQGIKVVEAATIQGVLYPHVYLMGLREGQFPKAKFENWIYNDQERKALNELGVTLPLTVTSMKIDQYFFASVLAMAQKTLTISYYADDEAGASGYLEELQQYYAKGALKATFYGLNAQNCFSEGELINILAQQENLGSQESVWLEHQVGADFVSRKELDKSRWQGQNIFNGYLGQKRECKYLSASALDNYVQCPFNYLVSNIWHSKPWEPLVQETQPAVTGDLYHFTLAKFLNKHLGENIGHMNYSELKAEILLDLAEIYKELLDKGCIFTSDFSTYEYRHYQMVLEKWLITEQTYQAEQKLNLLPQALELAFGRKESQLLGLSINVDNEETIFSGQIDRVDTDGNNYILTDYKSGAVPSAKAVALGRSLQLPIYVLALENLKKIQPEQIIGAGYYALKNSKRIGGMWENSVKQALPWLDNTHPNEFSMVMENAKKNIEFCIRGIRNSTFPASPADKCPSYCPCKDICRCRLDDGSQSVGKEGEDNA
ncbi:MAG: PD-(D/E)XK nuclease family protein, partial [Acidaminococcaceae bacterium]|nr:PD-(D/E)XK nuclease family protein [Acidaminococcaceae bacterium]